MIEAKEYQLLGAPVQLATMEELGALISDAVHSSGQVVVVGQNMHGLYLYHRTPQMRKIHASAHTRIDGMALVLLGRLLGLPVRREHRVTWLDWLDPLMAEAAARTWRVFYLGGRPGVAERGAEVLRQRHLGLVMGTQHGHFPADNPDMNDEVLHTIDHFDPDILMIGMGMPRQEIWLQENLRRLKANAVLTCGAALDYVAGEIPTPPRWLGRVGLEWLYRLASEPRRLSQRYLLEPWYLAPLLIRELWRRMSA